MVWPLLLIIPPVAGIIAGAINSNDRRNAEEALNAQRAAAAEAERQLQARLQQERAENERRERERQQRLQQELAAAEQRRREDEARRQKEREEAERRQREAEERQRREREAEEQRRREMEEKVRKEQERVRAAEAARELFEKYWRDGVHPGVAPLTPEQLRQARSSYLDGKTHIAFVGNSGVGKSTLTNSIRGLRSNSAGAALVNQDEGTRKTTQYTDTIHLQNVWYDVPGAGTLACPDWHYFMDKELYVYDALVVVFSDRLMLNDVRVLRNARELGIPAFLVRSKSDQIMRNMQEDHEESASRAKSRYVNETIEYVSGELNKDGGCHCEGDKAYMVSRDAVREVVTGQVGPGPAAVVLDEVEFVRDLLQVRARGE